MPDQSQQFNQDDYSQNQPQSSPPLGKSQKIAAAVLAVFAVFIIVLWLAQLKRSISQPFANQTTSGNQQVNSQAQNSDEALKAKDTDGDGLSDYDELNVYKTSPYLEDSDSDGISDGEEVKRGTDPNCPEGRNCSNAGIVNGDQSVVSPGETTQNNSTLNNLLNQSGATSQQPPTTATTSPNNTNVQSPLGNNIDAATLRQLLIANGMDKTMLDKISDQELMKSYQQMLAKPSP